MSAFTVLVICYNRPEYLTRTLGSIGAAWPSQGKGPRVLVSQDGTHSGVAGVARTGADTIKASWPAGTSGNLQFSHVQHTQSRHPGDDVSGYAALARHFGWAITRAFQSAPTQYVIIVEDDLELAGDFFSYFAAVAPLLDADSTLLAASAYNDIGQAEFVGDPGRVVRSDFFPGLGWMLTRSRWGELGPKWPGGYWDDWLREPAQRQGRNILRPEVSRSRTFGEKGVSRAQFFHKYLGNIHLNTAPAQWGSADLSYLDKAQWDSDLAAVVGGASKSASVAALAQQSCGPSPDLAAPVVFPGEHGWLAPSTMQAAGGLGAAAFKVEYSGFTGAGGYERLAQVRPPNGASAHCTPHPTPRTTDNRIHWGCQGTSPSDSIPGSGGLPPQGLLEAVGALWLDARLREQVINVAMRPHPNTDEY